MRPVVLFLGLLAAAGLSAGCLPLPPGHVPSLERAMFSLDRLDAVLVAPVETARTAPSPLPGETPKGPEARKASPATVPPRGGGGAPPPGRVDGVVVALEGIVERPLAGAVVRTSDGREAIAQADGSFRLDGGLGPDTALVASHPGYLASAISGVTGGGPLSLHLRPTANVTDSTEGPPQRLLARGRIVDPDGAPVPGVLVVLEDSRGSHSAPASTEADGTFELTVFAVDGRVEAGTLLAVGTPGDEWVGLATGVSLVPGVQNIDLDPSRAGLEPMAVARPGHTVRLAIDGGAVGLPARATVFLVAADGTSLSLPMTDTTVRVAAVAGAHYSLRAEAMSLDGNTQSLVSRDTLSINFNAAETNVSAALLAPPTVTLPTAPGQVVTWAPVTGAEAYHVALESMTQGAIWEGFTTKLALPLGLPDGPTDLERLTVAAWDADGLAVRQVAGLRPLRLLPESGTFRRSARQVRLSP